MKIVDEFTGRVLEGRRWSDGLHQAVEAKEGVAIKEENQTLATITLQNYYRMYERLAGMTGTAQTEASEFASTYNLHVVSVPTNRPAVRDDCSDLIYKSEDAKFAACTEDIRERNERGQPVLVGTVSVENSEKLSRLLDKQGVAHEVLNAKQHHREAEIVTQAGQLGSVTVATNMAGRGVDILLGGNPEGLAKRDLSAEGLEETTPEGAPAPGRAHGQAPGRHRRRARGSAGPGRAVRARHRAPRKPPHRQPAAGPVRAPGRSRREPLLPVSGGRPDEPVRHRCHELGDGKGPARGRAHRGGHGHQGHRAGQNTVEQRNAETRKNVLKYDEVMNAQRKVIYRRRSQILDGADLHAEALEYLESAVGGAIGTHCSSEHPEEWDREGLATELSGLWPGGVDGSRLEATASHDEVSEFVHRTAMDHYREREGELGTDVMRQVERQVMLRLIDQKWRSHLHEMDLLREGIHLRAMGQKDPATEWQREGFEMFGQLMDSIAVDFVRYVMHVQLAERPPEDTQRLEGVSADKDEEAPGQPARQARPAAPSRPAPRVPLVKSDLEKVGRNQPCPCGSGRKHKMCHGRPGAG